MFASALAGHTPQVLNKKIRNLHPETEDDANAEKTLEFEETNKFAGSGLDLPDFLFGPGVYGTPWRVASLMLLDNASTTGWRVKNSASHRLLTSLHSHSHSHSHQDMVLVFLGWSVEVVTSLCVHAPGNARTRQD